MTCDYDNFHPHLGVSFQHVWIWILSLRIGWGEGSALSRLEAGDWVTTELQVLHNISINTIITADSPEYIHISESRVISMPCYVAVLIAPVIPCYLSAVTSYPTLLSRLCHAQWWPDDTPPPVWPVPANIVLWLWRCRDEAKHRSYVPDTHSRVILASQNCKFDLDRENVSVKFPNSAKTTRNLNLLLFKEVSKYLRM